MRWYGDERICWQERSSLDPLVHGLYAGNVRFFSHAISLGPYIDDQLRVIWGDPTTRKALLAGLADKGFSSEPLAEMQNAIEAQNSDLFDVLAYVAFALAPETRTQRADMARAEVHQQFNDKQQAFVDFVLAQYVKQGVDESWMRRSCRRC